MSKPVPEPPQAVSDKNNNEKYNQKYFTSPECLIRIVINVSDYKINYKGPT